MLLNLRFWTFKTCVFLDLKFFTVAISAKETVYALET